MQYIIILAVVQGLTEFLPISSSGHLELFKHIPYLTDQSIDDFENLSANFLNLILHVGTLLAVIFYYRTQLWTILKVIINVSARAFSSLGNQSEIIDQETSSRFGIERDSDIFKLLFYLFISCLMLFPVIFFKDYLDIFLRKNPTDPVSLITLGIIFIINGIILNSSYLVFKYSRKNKGITLITSVIIGLSQNIAILPGISRSGCTITSAVWFKVHRRVAVNYSMLLSIPTILGGVLLEFKDLSFRSGGFDSSLIILLLIGILISFVIGLWSIRFLVRLVDKMLFYQFGIYTAIIGIFCILFSLWVI
jgi:undecaprenyl-diphosphatase